MSHIAKVGCVVRDLDALGEAAERKQAQLVLGQKTHRSYSGGRCEHAIRLLDNPAAYEVGVVPGAEAGTWDFAFDDWGAQGKALVDRFGGGLVGLQNEYLAVVAERQLRREGFMLQRVEEGQRIELRAYA